MSISLIPTDSKTRLTAVAKGDVTLDELMNFVATARAGEQRLLSVLVDASEAVTTMRPSEVQQFASYLGDERKSGPRGRVAIFAPSDEFFGIVRMLIAYGELVGVDHVAVFRSQSEAETWLDTA